MQKHTIDGILTHSFCHAYSFFTMKYISYRFHCKALSLLTVNAEYSNYIMYTIIVIIQYSCEGD